MYVCLRAGPAVILNTMCEANQSLFDEQCPTDFQAASSVYQVRTVVYYILGLCN